MHAIVLVIIVGDFSLIRPSIIAKIIVYALGQWHTCWPTLSLWLTKIARSFLWGQMSSPSLEPGYLGSNLGSILNNVSEQVTNFPAPQFLSL